MMQTYADQIAAWQAKRLGVVAADDGWLNVTDRLEARPGESSVGSATDNDLVLSVGPAHLGRLTLAGGKGSFLPVGAAEPLHFLPVTDASPQLRTNGLILELTELEGAYALRVRDCDPANRAGFPGLRYFPINPAWRITAAWEKMNTPQSFEIGMINGVATHVTLTHRAIFVYEGKQYQLLPTHVKSGQPMFVIRDLTSRSETYGASRFLYGENASGDRIVLDFNKAFNPPCAFTDHAICPLPPRENILPFRVEAGEMRPLDH